jgi:hypothetical protein
MGLDAQVFQDDNHTVALGRVRIGNVSAAAQLRRELEAFPGRFRIVQQRVIQDGNHCGDSIPLSLVADLKTELAQIPSGSDELNQFKAEMIVLCEIAIKHERGIEF